MNKTINKENVTLMGEIIKAAAEATKADVFVEYSPHIHGLRVEIHIPKWQSYVPATECLTTYIDGEYEESAQQTLALESILLRVMELQ